jgi:simple sugar transport system ATP-binding protein
MHIEMKDISIIFPGVRALDEVNFNMDTGNITALVGANGAGKSTLMKVLGGCHSHYKGSIYVNGEMVEIRSPRAAKKLGIEVVYQEVDSALIPYLSVAENVMFDTIVNEMDKKQLIHWNDIRRDARTVLKRLNVEFDISRKISELTLAEKQMVLIARCLVEKCKFLVLDEPTAPLSSTETKELFRVVRNLVKDDIGVIFISHRLNELYEICNTITVMRDGQVVASEIPLTADFTTSKIVELMLGRRLTELYEKRESNIGEILLEVDSVTERNGKVKDITLKVHEGEIIGIAGLVSAGKTELCKTLFGDLRISSGTIKLRGKTITCKSPTEAVQHGFALIPEERRKEGVLVTGKVYENISIASLRKYLTRFGVVKKEMEKKDARNMIQSLRIKTPSENQVVSLLSGGNQQKVVLGKWLNSDSEIYIYDEPTKGIDVGAKRDMYELINNLAVQGKGAIYATCEFSEILNICDRVYVMYSGRIVKELNVSETNEAELLYFSTGGK